jgi:hypothetical protein
MRLMGWCERIFTRSDIAGPEGTTISVMSDSLDRLGTASSQPSDEELVHAAVAGRDDAFASLVTPHLPRV